MDLSQYGPNEPVLITPTQVGRGFFAWYFAAEHRLAITVKCTFHFLAGTREILDPDPRDPKSLPLTAPPEILTVPAPPWQEAEKESWKARFLERCSSSWSGHHAFECTTKGSESLFAETVVRFVEVGADGNTGGTYDIEVYRWEHPDFSGANVKKDGTVQFDEAAIDEMTIVHEAGHMLGLGDEYPEDGKPPSPAAHSDLVYDDFGHEVIRGQVDPRRVMHQQSTGRYVVQEYGVVFAYALRQVTQKSWRFI